MRLHTQKGLVPARRQWLTPVILATQEAEIRRISVRSQPRQIVCESLSQKKKKPFTKKGWWTGSRCKPWPQTPISQKKGGGGLLLAVKVKVKLQQDTGLKGHLIYKVLHACWWTKHYILVDEQKKLIILPWPGGERCSGAHEQQDGSGEPFQLGVETHPMTDHALLPTTSTAGPYLPPLQSIPFQ
jgi:hypothetical protein